MTRDDIAQLVVLAGFLYFFGAAVWGLLWWGAGHATRRARMILATPIWPIAGLLILIPMAYDAITQLIIDAKIGGHRDS